MGSPVRWSKAGCASVRSSPSTMTRRSTGIICPPLSREGIISTSEGLAPASATKRNWSLAVRPRISLRRCGSCRPGICTRMRLAPWRWMFGSVVPSASTRRRSTSMAWSTARRTRSSMPAWLSVSWTVSPFVVMSMLRSPVWPRMALPMGCDSSRSRGSTLSRSASLAKRSCTPRGIATMPPCGATRVSRRIRLTSSRRVATCDRTRSFESTSSSTCEPPCRSRPSTTACVGTSHDGTQPGMASRRALRVSGAIRFGTARRQTNTVTASMRTTLVVEKRSMGQP
jgi:hypothetical protein